MAPAIHGKQGAGGAASARVPACCSSRGRAYRDREKFRRIRVARQDGPWSRRANEFQRVRSVRRQCMGRRSPVLSENHIRTYWWCNPDKIGMATMTPDRSTARPRGASLPKRQVRAHLIVIRRIQGKNLPQVRLTEDQHSVQTFAAHGADQAFRIAILPRRSRRDRSVSDAHGHHPSREDMSIRTVIVPYRTARVRTRMHGGVGGGGREADPYPDSPLHPIGPTRGQR